jgi:hypothetical protein
VAPAARPVAVDEAQLASPAAAAEWDWEHAERQSAEPAGAPWGPVSSGPLAGPEPSEGLPAVALAPVEGQQAATQVGAEVPTAQPDSPRSASREGARPQDHSGEPAE